MIDDAAKALEHEYKKNPDRDYLPRIAERRRKMSHEIYKQLDEMHYYDDVRKSRYYDDVRKSSEMIKTEAQ